MADWQDKRVTVLGFGRTGVSTALYLANHGASVLLSDSSAYTPEKEAQAQKLRDAGVKLEFGGHSDQAINSAQLVVTSPGVTKQPKHTQPISARGVDVICDIELVYRETSTPIVAITGTNGKSTTTALISFILQRAGYKAPACGNIGVPIFSQVKDDNDFLVAELSSYQLHYTRLFKPHVAVWLNLTPDHLDWHGSIEEYISAKKRIFSNQTSSDFAVLNFDDPLLAPLSPPSKVVPNSSRSELPNYDVAAFVRDDGIFMRWQGSEQLVCAIDEMQIIGKHNIENALAAVSAVVLCGVAPAQAGEHLKAFKALEHRLEYVATKNGVVFYNDSKATNTDSAIKALESFPTQKVVLIAGGKDKGTPLGDFVLAVRKYASAVILIGEAKKRFERALMDGGVENIYQAESLEEAVRLGERLKSGPVLLSPACASFDMFKDFEDRGRVFKDIVCTRL